MGRFLRVLARGASSGSCPISSQITFFTESHVEKDELEEYKKAMGKHWSREIMEGATLPPTLKLKKNSKKQKY